MRKLMVVVALLAIAGLSGKVFAGVPGAILVSSTTINPGVPNRGMPKDGSGIVFAEDHFLGYKVFVATSLLPVQLTDEMGAVVQSGMVHSVVLSSGTPNTDYLMLYDSSTTNGFNTLSALAVTEQITPPLVRTSSVVINVPLDVQFNNGLIMIQGGVANPASVLWRPSKGSSN